MLSLRARISSISRSTRDFLDEAGFSGVSLGSESFTLSSCGVFPCLEMMHIWYSTRPMRLKAVVFLHRCIPAICSCVHVSGATMSANVFRFNVVDGSGSVSFVGPGHGLKVIAAACSHGPQRVQELLSYARRYDAEWASTVLGGLSVFDEHNVEGVTSRYEEVIACEDDVQHQPFRVVNGLTRSRSMVPAKLGLVVINLNEKRIIQIHNSYADLSRRGRGRIRKEGRPTRSLFHYELPETWRIVP